MAKLGVFVGVYSVILLTLFGVFCYLITTVNPPLKNLNTTKYSANDYVYSNELAENDNVAYGLEKADYDVALNSLKRRSNKLDICKTITPKVYLDKTKTNRKKEELKVTKSMKHIKGLRRSINNENQRDDDLRRTIHLKIKDLVGHPKIEIKVVPDKCKTKESRKSRSSSNATKEDVANNKMKYIDNFSEEVVIDLVRNETIVLDFTENFINLSEPRTDEVNKEEDILLNSFLIGAISKKVFETTSKLYTVDLLKAPNIDYQFEMTNRNDKTANNFGNSSAGYDLIGNKDDTKSMSSLFNPTTNKNGTDLYRFYNITKSLQNDTNTLVGLLIPEATATLPYNDHL